MDISPWGNDNSLADIIESRTDPRLPLPFTRQSSRVPLAPTPHKRSLLLTPSKAIVARDMVPPQRKGISHQTQVQSRWLQVLDFSQF